MPRNERHSYAEPDWHPLREPEDWWTRRLECGCALHLRQDARGDLLILENSEVMSR